MGYHKKFITEELLRSIYENDGYQLMIENTSEEKIKEFFELN
jgi:hypothetical protein